ncbi:MAG: peptidase [marine bacterium B5-7]|nr:MAG: peptidase [marine bacterium B5-7]
MYGMNRSKPSTAWTWIKRLMLAAVALGLTMAVAGGVFLYKLMPSVPSVESIRDIELKVPLRVFTIDGQLIGEYGDYRRSPTHIEDVPPLMIEAILAAEDNNFYDHPGVDFKGIARAFFANLRSGGHGQGASTITMQVARNYFLSREKTYTRKIKEILLSFRLEQELEKNEILELYINKIFLGHRSYGFQAAAQFYYDKPLNELSVAEIAMLAGLPKAPSRSNPLSNPKSALDRRNYVLRRMHELDNIDLPTFELATAAPLTAARHASLVDIDAPYVAEMARDYIYEKYGDRAYESGFQIYTTIKGKNQVAANEALRSGLLAYDRRHGFRGVLTHIEPDAIEDNDALNGILRNFVSSGSLQPAMVIAADKDVIKAYAPDLGEITIDSEGWSWATDDPSTLLKVGDVVHVTPRDDSNWWLAQIPEVSGAMVSLDPRDGAILALVGGFDYYLGKFNRATQARRQPGSNLKPFIYSAALENGFTASTLVSGAPIVIDDPVEGTWRPENYSGKFYGPTRIREALTQSMNLVSVRLLRAMGLQVVLDHLQTFGFDRDQLPKGLSLALGTATLTPLEIASAYAVFANGGYRVEPYYISRVEDQNGEIVEYSNRVKICEECELSELEQATNPDRPDPRYARQVLSPENTFLMTSMMRDVIRVGTGKKAMELGRNDLAGKTGTTNDFRDAWFSGFNDQVTATVWVGNDQPTTLGKSESGARAALPIWIDYMRVALDGIPEKPLEAPENVVSTLVSRETGEAVPPGSANAMTEYFIMGTEPQLDPNQSNLVRDGNGGNQKNVQDLF